MSEAFKCEVCDTYFPLEKVGRRQQIEVRVNKNLIVVFFDTNMAEGADREDICHPCMMQALGKALTKLLQEGEKQGT